MTRDDVAHVPRQQAIPVFFDIEQRDAGARQRFRAEGKTSRIERRRSDAESHQHAVQGSAGFWRRQHVETSGRDQQCGARQGEHGGERDHAARCRERCFQRNHDEPDRGKGFNTAGVHGDNHDETGKRQRRQQMCAFVAAGA